MSKEAHSIEDISEVRKPQRWEPENLDQVLNDL